MENYKIKIKTKEGTYEYEEDDLKELDLIIEKHKDYEEVQAKKVKVKKLGNNNKISTN